MASAQSSKAPEGHSANNPVGQGRDPDTDMFMNKILVIEDEPEMRRNLIAILRLERFHPLAAENGQIGVELAKKEKPDLILCDVMMPKLDGYGVIAALRASAEKHPLLIGRGGCPAAGKAEEGGRPSHGAGRNGAWKSLHAFPGQRSAQ